MNLDKELKQALKVDAKQIDELMAQDQGLFSRLLGIWQGNMRWWVAIVNVFTLIMTGLFIWCFYEFYQAEDVMDRLYWGVCFVAALLVQAMLKMWLFMEMNRQSLMREIKRVEIELARLRGA